MHLQNDEADFDSRIVKLKTYAMTAGTHIDGAAQASKRYSNILGIADQKPCARVAFCVHAAEDSRRDVSCYTRPKRNCIAIACSWR